MYTLTLICFFTNNMCYFPTYIAIGSGGKEETAIAIMHTLSYMIAFTCFYSHFVIVYSAPRHVLGKMKFLMFCYFLRKSSALHLFN